LTTIISGVLIGLEAFRRLTVVSIIFFLGTLITFALATLTSTGKLSLFIAAFTISYSLWAFSGTVIAIHGLRGYLKRATDVFPLSALHFTDLTKTGLPLIIVSAISGSVPWTISTILVTSAAEAQHAQFLIGLQWASLATFLPTVLTKVLFPRMVKQRLATEADRRQRLTALLAASGFATALTLAASGVICIFGTYIDKFYSSNYRHVATLVVVYVVSSVPGSVANLFGNQLVAEGRNYAWLASVTVGALFMFLVMWLLRGNGAYAPPIAMAAGYLTMILIALLTLLGKQSLRAA
jgi:O-antigen/teichoic acid export membrane protein